MAAIRYIRTLNDGYLWVNIKPFLRISSHGTQRELHPLFKMFDPLPLCITQTLENRRLYFPFVEVLM